MYGYFFEVMMNYYLLTSLDILLLLCLILSLAGEFLNEDPVETSTERDGSVTGVQHDDEYPQSSQVFGDKCMSTCSSGSQTSRMIG